MRIKKGYRVKVKAGTTDKVRQSSMVHWKNIPAIDGHSFTINKLVDDSHCYLVHPDLPDDLYMLSASQLERTT